MSAREEAAAANDDPERRIERPERRQRLGDTCSVAAFRRAVGRLCDLGAKDRRIACIVCDHEGGHGAFGELADRRAFDGGVPKRHVCPKCDCVFGPLKYLDMDEGVVGLGDKMHNINYPESGLLAAEARAFDAPGPSSTGPCREYRHAHARFHAPFPTGRSPCVLAGRTRLRASRVAADGEQINFPSERGR